jgi:hypothetical protein
MIYCYCPNVLAFATVAIFGVNKKGCGLIHRSHNLRKGRGVEHGAIPWEIKFDILI